MSVLFAEYPKCTTCQKAKKWLDAAGVSYEDATSRNRILPQRSLRNGIR